MCPQKIIFSSLCLLSLSGCHSVYDPLRVNTYTPWTPVHKTIYSEPTISQHKLLTGKHSLPELIEIGLKHNPQTKHAWWRAQESFALQGKAEAKFFPTVEVSTNINRTQVGELKNKPTQISDNWGPATTLTYKIFQFGADTAAAKSATHMLYAANYEFNRQLQKTVSEIQQAFYKFASAHAKIEARESSLQDAISSLNAVSQKKANGLACIQDVLLAKADQLQAEYELQAAKADLESCRATLATVVGIPISEDFSIESGYLQAEEHQIVKDAKSLMKETLHKRADLLASEEVLQAKKWNQMATERGSLPAFVITAQTGLTKHKHHVHWQKNYGLLAGIQWDIFTGFDRQYSELASYAQWQEQKYTLRQLKLEALRQTWTAFHDFQSSIQLAKAARALEQASQEALEAIRIGYNAGINSLLNLLSAQKTLANARLNSIQAQTNIKLTLVQLAYATGQLEVKAPYSL